MHGERYFDMRRVPSLILSCGASRRVRDVNGAVPAFHAIFNMNIKELLQDGHEVGYTRRSLGLPTGGVNGTCSGSNALLGRLRYDHLS